MKKALLTALIIGSMLRLLWLGSIPAGFFRDEAALGYNAYSLWETGRDEYGVFLPLVFRSFEVFFLPLYEYLAAPMVGILGLTEFWTRFLSAFSGIVAIYLAYLVAKEIWGKKAGLFSAFVLAVSPWHIFYSRGAFEGNLALTLFALGFYFWLKFMKKFEVKFFFLSTLSFAFSMYSYQAERLVVPLFLFSAILASLGAIAKIKTKLILPGGIVLLVLIPLASLSFKAGGYHRAFGVSVFSKEENPPGWIEGRDAGFLINNYFYLRGRQLASLYLSYFSPRNLFVEGDYDKQRSVENFSVFYSFLIPAFLIGIWKIFKKPLLKEKLFASYLFLGPLPAALTGDPFHTYRSLLTYFPLTLAIGYGLKEISGIFKEKRKIFYCVLALLFAGYLALFTYNYAVITQSRRARAWDQGYRKMVEFVNTLPPQTRVVIDDPWSEAYIHFLFFGKIDPKKYHKSVESLGPVESYYYSDPGEIRPTGLGNWEFRRVDWPKERGKKGKVFIIWAEKLPESEFRTDPKVKLLKEIKYPDGKVAYRIVKIL